MKRCNCCHKIKEEYKLIDKHDKENEKVYKVLSRIFDKYIFMNKEKYVSVCKDCLFKIDKIDFELSYNTYSLEDLKTIGIFKLKIREIKEIQKDIARDIVIASKCRSLEYKNELIERNFNYILFTNSGLSLSENKIGKREVKVKKSKS